MSASASGNRADALESVTFFAHQTFMLYLDPLSRDENWLSGKRPS